MSPRRKIRCAIYTRKSSEDGLDQDFNSLDAQYEACAAYVASQRHEGWTLLSGRYDDGGLSGGTLERPALQRLLEEIDAGRVLSDKFEPVSVRPVTLSFIPCQVRATRQERRCVSA